MSKSLGILFSDLDIDNIDYNKYSYYINGWEFNTIVRMGDVVTLYFENEYNTIAKVASFFIDTPQLVNYYEREK